VCLPSFERDCDFDSFNRSMATQSLALYRIDKILSFLAYAIWFVICYAWLKFFKLFLAPGCQRFRKTKTSHAVLVIGDGFAEGFGDALFRSPGISKRLQERLSANPSIKQSWTVFNRGHYAATSRDWLPSATHKPLYSQSGVKRTLWKDNFEQSWSNEAEVVLLMLGFSDNDYAEDEDITVEETVKNLKTISCELKERGKIVFVATVAVQGNPRKRHCHCKLNRLLMDFLRDVNNEENGNGKIFPGVRLDEMPLSMNAYYNEDYHLNNKGYAACAKAWEDVVLPELKKLEWQNFKAMLFSQKNIE